MAPQRKKRTAEDSTEATKPQQKRTKRSSSLPGAAHQPAKTLARLPYTSAPSLSTHFLLIWVGPQRELFTLHTNLLPERTLAILEAKAQQPRYWNITEATPETFELYRLFLYTGKLFSHDRADNGRVEAHGDAEWTHLALAFLLGLELDDEKFRNAVVDAIVEKVAETMILEPVHQREEQNQLTHPGPLPDRPTEIYTQTQPGDKLRSLIVDLHVWKGLGTGVRPPHEDAEGPREFVQDVLAELAASGPHPYAEDAMVPWDEDCCGYYHVHEVTAKCEKRKAGRA